MGWGWYVQNDMQLFIMSLFLMFLYSIKPLASKILMIILMVVSMAFNYITNLNSNANIIAHPTFHRKPLEAALSAPSSIGGMSRPRLVNFGDRNVPGPSQ